MTPLACKIFFHSALGAAISLGALGHATAGAVSTNFDPPFGASLPNLSYKGSINFNVTDACAGNAAGLVTVNAFASCGGPITATTSLTLFDTVGATSTTAVFSLLVGFLDVLDGFVVGWYTTVSPFMTDFYPTTSANGKDFTFAYGGSLPMLYSYDHCGPACGYNPQLASLDGIQETIHHLGDNGQSRYGQDSNGVDIGYKVTLDKGAAVYTPTGARAGTVPEPASLALVAGALVAAGLARRRSISAQAA
jgi:hypothetical protein